MKHEWLTPYQHPSTSINIDPRQLCDQISPLATVVQCRYSKSPIHTSRRESRWWCRSIVLKCGILSIKMKFLPHSWEIWVGTSWTKKILQKHRLHYVTPMCQSKPCIIPPRDESMTVMAFVSKSGLSVIPFICWGPGISWFIDPMNTIAIQVYKYHKP